MLTTAWADFGHFLAVYFGVIVVAFCLRRLILWVRPKVIKLFEREP